MWEFLRRQLKLPLLENRFEQLEYKVGQIQSDSTTELQQSRIDRLEEQINQLQSDTTIADQQSRIDRLEEQINQLQSDTTIADQQSRLDRLEEEINQLQSDTTITYQQSRIDQLEQELSKKLVILAEQNSAIASLIQRVERLENQPSPTPDSVTSDLPEDLLDFSPRLTLLEQQLGCSQPSDDARFITVNSIDNVTDISVGSVYFEGLKKLVEQYGVPLSYPDRTFRGSRPLSRQEFVQHIAALLTRMEQEITN